MPRPILDAAAVMLVRQKGAARELYWVQRSRDVSLGGGFYAFPGGRTDPADAALGRGDPDATLRLAAIRELFEESGVLLASGMFPAEALAQARRALLNEERSFADLLSELRATPNLDALSPAGRWLTPPFMPIRFDTRFFTAFVPEGQSPEVWPGELARGEWITPLDALKRWERGRALLHPPAQHLIECLRDAPLPDALPRMSAAPHLVDWVAQRIEFQKGVLLAPVRTPTIPPATHTNCYIVGEEELVVIDPASPYPEEQQWLADLCDGLRQEGRRFHEILLTHHHHDHVGGVNHLREKLGIPVRAHATTAKLIRDEIAVDGFIQADEVISLPGDLDLRLRAVFTPGHAPGHLCFLEEHSGALFTGDMVAGLGSIVVNPPEGDMSDYVASLHKLRSLPVTAIYPAHGPTIPDGVAKLDEYIAHRAERENQVVAALGTVGPSTPEELVPTVYADTPAVMYPLAARSLMAVLDKLVKERRVAQLPDGRFRVQA